MLSIYHSNFTGGSNVAPQSGSRKRPNYRESSDDESRPPRKAVAKKKAVVEEPVVKKKKSLVVKKSVSSKKKGKEARLNYKTDISTADYTVIRQGNWYSRPRDNELDDRRFWCKEQSYIHTDIYLDYSILSVL